MRISDWSSDVCSSDLDDRKRQGMFGCPFDASCQPKNIILRKAGHRHDRGHGRAPLGQGAGLVDDDRIDPLHSLERLGILRSEEHTSELQSLMRISYAVFCLKKKNNIRNTNKIN